MCARGRVSVWEAVLGTGFGGGCGFIAFSFVAAAFTVSAVTAAPQVSRTRAQV